MGRGRVMKSRYEEVCATPKFSFKKLGDPQPVE